MWCRGGRPYFGTAGRRIEGRAQEVRCGRRADIVASTARSRSSSSMRSTVNSSRIAGGVSRWRRRLYGALGVMLRRMMSSDRGRGVSPRSGFGILREQFHGGQTNHIGTKTRNEQRIPSLGTWLDLKICKPQKGYSASEIANQQDLLPAIRYWTTTLHVRFR